MNRLFTDFPVPGFTEWEAKLIADLKGQSRDLIRRTDELEGIQYDCYQHADTVELADELPGQGMHTRGALRTDNTWVNYATVEVNGNERQANEQALRLLNMGATGLRFVLFGEAIQVGTLLKGIELPYIQTTFVIHRIAQLDAIRTYTMQVPGDCIHFELDPFRVNGSDYTALASLLKEKTQRCLVADGASLLQCGANSSQEIAWCLSVAHEHLVQLIHAGLSVDDAAASIHFVMGASGSYFYDIAKIRTLKRLWACIVSDYAPTREESKDAAVNGRTVFHNKSLSDPHTNLLRLTTEAMSLLVAGVEGISVLPYDLYAAKGISELSERMALNIPTILQEESYFDKVIDPLAGSYSTEHLTNLFSDQAWALFQEWETAGGVRNATCLENIRSAVRTSADIRTERLRDKKDVLIGINIFPNPAAETTQWKSLPEYLGLPALILEKTNTEHA